jgi:hypothetical protein
MLTHKTTLSFEVREDGSWHKIGSSPVASQPASPPISPSRVHRGGEADLQAGQSSPPREYDVSMPNYNPYGDGHGWNHAHGYSGHGYHHSQSYPYDASSHHAHGSHYDHDAGSDLLPHPGWPWSSPPKQQWHEIPESERSGPWHGQMPDVNEVAPGFYQSVHGKLRLH